jgi:hypothetical protein
VAFPLSSFSFFYAQNIACDSDSLGAIVHIRANMWLQKSDVHASIYQNFMGIQLEGSPLLRSGSDFASSEFSTEIQTVGITLLNPHHRFIRSDFAPHFLQFASPVLRTFCSCFDRVFTR